MPGYYRQAMLIVFEVQHLRFPTDRDLIGAGMFFGRRKATTAAENDGSLIIKSDFVKGELNMSHYEFSTLHAAERARQRLGLSAPAACKRFEKVLRLGKRAGDFKEWYPHNYLKSLERENCRAFVYGNAIYLFSRECDVCITTYLIPRDFHLGGPESSVKLRNLHKYHLSKTNAYAT